ncbi:nitroreductase family protein [Thermococcus paralvinellae]|uniref:Nitroreductase family protein n=1 Tax=Thermococcus paralvinellae TaxID=582419 RepID=W0I8D3_9EURY|nr:nitroreductase family protein [Thermococcus paralvinellae]AHF80987.1 Nitroreductase family protein [Thermococcus paralvinellae]
MEIIKGRRAVRDFRDKEIPKEKLMAILEAGIWAPSGSNIQPWEFILVTEKAMIEKIKLISPGLFGNPTAIVVLCINRERAKRGGRLGGITALMDISMAAQNMMLIAYSMGIGSCPIVSFSKSAWKELIGIPEHVEPVLILSLGYPKFWPKPPKRRPLEEVVHVERYGRHFKG